MKLLDQLEEAKAFNKWLQGRLNEHGADPKLETDGDVGPLTRKALRGFQADRRELEVTGVADEDTVKALQKPAKGEIYVPAEKPTELMPPWLVEMSRRMGLHERRDNRSLIQWLKSGKYLGNPAKLPWCGDATETCFARTLEAEKLPANPFFAQNWKDFGIDAGGPKVGAVGVIRWSAKRGHVGMVIDYDSVRQRVKLRGGNQSDMITDRWFNLKDFIAFRWPKTYPLRIYPAVKSSAVHGSASGTR